jgi:AraC-like DNA-binding protein
VKASDLSLYKNFSSIRIYEHNIAPRKDYTIQRCYHTLRICLIKQGIGEWVIGSRSFHIKKDDIFIFNNIEKRMVKTVLPPHSLEMVVIEFEPRFIWTYSDNIFDSSYLKIFFGRSEKFENRLDRSNPITESVKSLILDTVEEFNNKLPEYQQMMKVKLLNILVNINRHYPYTETEPYFAPKESYSHINKAMDYIDNHISDEIQLNALADIAHMNPCYFSTIFKKYNGLSPSQYITRKRIYKAIDYLTTSDYSVIEISSLCGYNTAANFYKAFKTVTGRIPKDYRTGLVSY